MAGGGGVPRPRAQAAARGGRRKHQTPSLPLDIVLEIAAFSDPATLVRCAAICSDVRRRVVADDNGQAFSRRLRLRHADRFVPSFLRGHLEYRYLDNNYYREAALHLVDITAGADTTTARRLNSADGFPPHPDGKTVRRHEPVASRGGLLLVRTSDWNPRHEELRVCDPSTGRSQTLPPEPTFPGVAQKCWEPYVLLVSDGEVGGTASTDGIWPFQVLKANLVMSDHRRYLETQTFSSANGGAWGRYTEIRTPHLHAGSLLRGGRPMVAAGAVHWLCVTKSGGYILKLHIRTAQVTVTALPVSFPSSSHRDIDYLLATTTAGGGELMVLVADSKKKNISAWVQTTKPMAKWKQRPQMVMEYEAMLRFRNIRSSSSWTFYVQLHWFAERSGLVLLSSYSYGEFWLDLRSMEIVRWFPAGPTYRSECLPCEMGLSSWAPTFSSTI